MNPGRRGEAKSTRGRVRRERPTGTSSAFLEKQGGHVTVALAYPNTYAVAMASLGFQFVFRQLNSMSGVLCLRVFLPEGPLEGQPALKTYDHPREVAGADWLAFSASYENDYPNILTIIDASGIPLKSQDRDERYPLVVAGGIASSLNPEPLADFVDLFVIGEAEEILPDLVSIYWGARDDGVGKKEILRSMTKVSGVYVPRFYKPLYTAGGLLKSFKPVDDVPRRVARRWVKELDLFPADSAITSEMAGFGDMTLVEIGRGCGRGCRFCAAGFFYRPVRHRSFRALRELIEGLLPDVNRIGLLGASVLDHPEFQDMAAFLDERNCSFSVSSIRADAVTADGLNLMARGGLKTVTIAPETGSERLREVVRKNITDEEIFTAVEIITAAGIPNIKLYFMIGLPSETKRDIEAIVDLVKKIRHHILLVNRKRGATGTIIVSVSCYVPKAWTPFQWHPMDDIDKLVEKQRYLKRELSRIPNVRGMHDVPRWALIQALLSRGDRRLGDVLLLAHRFKGNWKKALRHSPVNPEFYVYRPRKYKELFPWDFIDAGVRKSYLWKEYTSSLA